MEKRRISLILLCIFIVSIICAVVIGVSIFPREKEYLQALNYSETTETILNPDQGFYRTGFLNLFRDGTNRSSYSAKADFQLCHLRVDISDFSGVVNASSDEDVPLTEQGLDAVDSALDYFKTREKNVIIRFAYDPSFGGAANKEPGVEMILTHIKQLCPILNKYESTLTAVEVGLVGPWGEMHTSKIANKEVINQLIETFLTNTINLPVLVRTPQMIYDYLGITFADIETAVIPETAYRLGMFNDGYLGSSNDLGTYRKNREAETRFIARQTEHLPYGGEVTVPGSDLHDIDKCLPEMFLMNLSYLNYEWNNEVVQSKWKQSYYTEECGTDSLYYGKTAFDYIQNHLGYRLVLRESVFSYTKKMDNLKIKLSIENVGFGNLNRSKDLTIYFVNENGDKVEVDVGEYRGENTIQVSTPINLERGNYKVYLGISTIENGTPTYSVRFANNLWDDHLKGNLVGNLTIK